MALKDKILGDSLDGLKVGDSEVVATDENNATVANVHIVTKSFNRDGLTARKAQLEGELAAIVAVLAEMDKAK